jgi:hypothetical protein
MEIGSIFTDGISSWRKQFLQVLISHTEVESKMGYSGKKNKHLDLLL